MQRFYIVINSICKLTKFSSKYQIFFSFILTYAQHYPPPEYEFHRYLSVYQLNTQILPKYIFSANVQKKASRLFEV